jgi:hypothetical protein
MGNKMRGQLAVHGKSRVLGPVDQILDPKLAGQTDIGNLFL